MEPNAMKETAKRWIRALFDDGEYDLIGELATDDWTYRLNALVCDASSLPEVSRGFKAAFPDLNNTFEEQVLEGNVVVTRGTTRGTHRGPLGEIAPTGKSVEVPWVIFTRFEGDKIAEDHEIYDELGILKQLGVM